MVWSTRMPPGGIEASTPASPNTTPRTSAGEPTIVNTTSLTRAKAAGVSAHVAPRHRSDSALLRVRVKTVSPKPASSRCPAMEWPITPVPIQPRRVRPGPAIVGHNREANAGGNNVIDDFQQTLSPPAHWAFEHLTEQNHLPDRDWVSQQMCEFNRPRHRCWLRGGVFARWFLLAKAQC